MRKFVVGDIHGGLRALKQVLERASFNPDEDMLIGIGDYADGWPDVYDTIEFLRTLPNFKGVLGNHDDWLLDYLIQDYAPYIWLIQGGKASHLDYIHKIGTEEFNNHKKFLESLPLHLVIDNKLFVHGGVYYDDEGVSVETTNDKTKLWDRQLFTEVVSYWKGKKTNFPPSTKPFDEIYIGHTTTQLVQTDFAPVACNGFFLIDQGGGWDGKLTLMDIDTHEYWQSDFVPTLYPEVKGRA